MNIEAEYRNEQMILNQDSQYLPTYQENDSFDQFHRASAVEQYISINPSQEQFNQFRTQQMKSNTKNTPKTFACKFNKFLSSYVQSNKDKGPLTDINKFIQKKKKRQSDTQVSYGLKDFNQLLQGQTPELAEKYLTQGLYLDLLQSNRILAPQDLINSIEYYALQFQNGKVEINRPHVKKYETKYKRRKLSE